MKPFPHSVVTTFQLPFCLLAVASGQAQPSNSAPGAVTAVSPAPSAVPASTSQTPQALEPVVVTASPLDRTLFEQAQPVSVLSGEELKQALQPTLGETLSKLPGVSSTGFAPGASRPVIRGMGDDRIRILSNGVGTVDVSNVSPDHAVTLDPLVMDSVEVVRGPAALLYGPNGVGGVVNVLDSRVPQERLEPGLGGLPVSGKLDSRYDTGSDLWSGGGAVNFGLGPVVIHFDGFRRESDDMVIPGDARSERLRQREPLPSGESEDRNRLPNSATDTQGGALGASWIWDKGFIGASYSIFDSNYGTVAEKTVTIDLDQSRWDGRGAFYDPFAGIREINYKFGYSDYTHTEFEGPEVGTVFNIEGYDGRVEVKHQKLGPFEGAFGYQTTHSSFSALGEEAFLPPTESDTWSAFLFEEAVTGSLRWQWGLRYDHSTVDSETYSDFGPGRDRSFDALSGSAGVVWELSDDYNLAFNASYTQRAPTYVELLADGPHLATGAYERGDDGLDLEKSIGFDLTLRKQSGFVTGSAGLFYQHFNDYIALMPTGEDFLFGEDGEFENLPIQNYRATDADFAGGELEATFHLLAPAEAPAPASAALSGKNPVGKSPVTPSGTVTATGADRSLDLELRADYVITRDLDNGGSLPRIPPFRASAALVYRYQRLTARLEGQYAAAQFRTADEELPTDSYFLINAGLNYRVLEGPVTVDVFLRGTNLGNEEARQHTSFLKDIAPMQGRALLVGLQAGF
ncbi:MAG: TonB-dependent receptor [Verrucomicrobiota bacterium]